MECTEVWKCKLEMDCSLRMKGEKEGPGKGAESLLEVRRLHLRKKGVRMS